MEYKREIEEVTGEVYVLVNGKKYVKSKKRHKLILTLIIAVIYTEVKFKLKKLGNKGKRELMVLDVDKMINRKEKELQKFKELINREWQLSLQEDDFLNEVLSLLLSRETEHMEKIINTKYLK